jgi:DNA-binding NtrC family response regulator
MMKAGLDADERSFFALVCRAVSANPFSEERQFLDLKIAGRYSGRRKREPKSLPGRTIEEVIQEVGVRIKRLEAQQRANVSLYRGEDRFLVRWALLFHVFHLSIPQFDQLIIDQMAAGDRNLHVPFAPGILTMLRSYGFSSDEACRCFGIFFQMRRAFFFIQQNLVGSSPCMVKLRECLWNNVFTHSIDLYDDHLWNRMEDFSTMILGPTGAGKGTAAAAIGRSGYIPFDRKKNCFVENFTSAFISINLSQYSETLIESELFGHKKGAFTGAIENYQGVFDRCSPYGAILLDEIGEVSRPVQIKLLQVLQERRFVPVGDHQKRRFSGRVIAATNRPLAQIRERRILRDDFFYRLCSDIIIVPGLSQRIAEDQHELNGLVDHTIQRILGKPSPELAGEIRRQIAEQIVNRYSWPGNVRELEQCVRRMLISGNYTPFEQPQQMELAGYLKNGIADGALDAKSLMTGYCYMLYRCHGTYEAVAQCLRLDRRTVKKHIESGKKQFGGETRSDHP